MKKILVAAVTIVALVAGTESPTAAQTGGEPTEVPLQVRGGRLVVQVEAADGDELEFILSTGNSVTVFSESTASRLGDQTDLSLGGVPVLTEGHVTIPDERLTSDGHAFDGIVGSNTLNQFDVLVDVPGGRLVLKPIGRSVEWADMNLSEPVRLRVMHGMVLGLDVELDGRAYPAMLDLGTPTLVVNEPVRTAMQLDEEDVSTLKVGGTTRDLPLRVLDLEVLRMWDPEGEGFVLVGAPVAYDCAISLSWVHREMRTCVQ